MEVILLEDEWNFVILKDIILYLLNLKLLWNIAVLCVGHVLTPNVNIMVNIMNVCSKT